VGPLLWGLVQDFATALAEERLAVIAPESGEALLAVLAEGQGLALCTRG
jgi:hypothetical protein